MFGDVEPHFLGACSDSSRARRPHSSASRFDLSSITGDDGRPPPAAERRRSRRRCRPPVTPSPSTRRSRSLVVPPADRRAKQTGAGQLAHDDAAIVSAAAAVSPGTRNDTSVAWSASVTTSKPRRAAARGTLGQLAARSKRPSGRSVSAASRPASDVRRSERRVEAARTVLRLPRGRGDVVSLGARIRDETRPAATRDRRRRAHRSHPARTATSARSRCRSPRRWRRRRSRPTPARRRRAPGPASRRAASCHGKTVPSIHETADSAISRVRRRDLCARSGRARRPRRVAHLRDPERRAAREQAARSARSARRPS